MKSELSQRLRARVLEVLALVADEAVQRKYQATAPHVDVPAELFNQWDDSFFPDDAQFRTAFDPAELGALDEFDAVVREVSETTPKQLPPLDAFVATDAWRRLSAAAQAALGEMKR